MRAEWGEGERVDGAAKHDELGVAVEALLAGELRKVLREAVRVALQPVERVGVADLATHRIGACAHGEVGAQRPQQRVPALPRLSVERLEVGSSSGLRVHIDVRLNDSVRCQVLGQRGRVAGERGVDVLLDGIGFFT